MGDSVTFSGSGETDQGWTAGVSYELDGGTFDDYKLTLDMGDSGKLTFSGASVSGDGIHMVNDIVPAAVNAEYSPSECPAKASGRNLSPITLDIITEWM